MTPHVEVFLHDTEFEVLLRDGGGGGGGEAPVRLRFAPAKLASGLSDIGVLLRATSGALTPALRGHFAEHFGGGQAGTSGCGFCKLQGKILTAQGRRPVTPEEHRAAAKVVPQGRTAFGALHAASSRAEAAERRAARAPQLAASKRSFAEVLF